MSSTAPAETAFPQKMFYRINEVCQITGVKPYVLRYWETEFPQLSPDKDSNDQRRYRVKDISLINEIKRLLYEEKFTIAGARQYLENHPEQEPACVVEVVPGKSRADARVVKRLRRKVEELRREMGHLYNFI